MQAIKEELEKELAAINDRCLAGEINFKDRWALCLAAFSVANQKVISATIAEAVAATVAATKDMAPMVTVISRAADPEYNLREWIMPPLGVNGLIGRCVTISLGSRRGVADSALFLHQTGNTESDLRSFRYDLILKKAANRQKYKCRAVADAALWLWLNTGTERSALISVGSLDIIEAYNRVRKGHAVADAGQWVFQHMSFFTDAARKHSRATSEILKGASPDEVLTIYARGLEVYDAARTKVADAAWYLVETDHLLPHSGKHLIAAAKEHYDKRRIIAGQARWLHQVGEWCQDELADASAETIRNAQTRSFLAYQHERLKTAYAAEFLYMTGKSSQATLCARESNAIQVAGESQARLYELTRTKTADKAWTLYDDGFSEFALDRMIALESL